MSIVRGVLCPIKSTVDGRVELGLDGEVLLTIAISDDSRP